MVGFLRKVMKLSRLSSSKPSRHTQKRYSDETIHMETRMALALRAFVPCHSLLMIGRFKLMFTIIVFRQLSIMKETLISRFKQE